MSTRKTIFHVCLLQISLKLCLAFTALLSITGCSSALPQNIDKNPDPLARENIDPNTSFSDAKILDILRAEREYESRSDAQTNDPSALSERRRILSMWEEFLIDNQQNFDALLLYGKFCRKNGSPEMAYTAFKRAEKINPNVAVLQQQLALYESENGLFDEAKEHITRAIELEPKNASYYTQRAQLIIIYRQYLVESGKYKQKELDDEMLSSYRRAAELLPNDIETRKNYALAFFDMGKADWNEALEQWKYILKISSLNIEKRIAEINIARVLIELKRDTEAEKLLYTLNDPSLEEIKFSLLEIIQKEKVKVGDKSAERIEK